MRATQTCAHVLKIDGLSKYLLLGQTRSRTYPPITWYVTNAPKFYKDKLLETLKTLPIEMWPTKAEA